MSRVVPLHAPHQNQSPSSRQRQVVAVASIYIVLESGGMQINLDDRLDKETVDLAATFTE